MNAFLFGAETWRRMVTVHVGLAAMLAVRIAFGPYPGLAGQPAALFRPVWFLAPLHAVPPLAVIVGVQAVGVIAGVVAIVRDGRRRRVAFAVAWASLMVLAGLRGSLGKILHNDVLLLLVCVPFLAAPVSRRREEGNEPSPHYGWPVRTAMVVIAGAYFFCGLQKLRTSGLAWATTDNLRYVFSVAARSGRPARPEVAEFLARQDLLSHVLAAGILTVELAFPLVLLWAGCRPAFAAAAVALHAGTWLTLGIDYWTWIGVVAVVLVNWEDVLAAAGTRRRSRPGQPPPDVDRLAARPAWGGRLASRAGS